MFFNEELEHAVKTRNYKLIQDLVKDKNISLDIQDDNAPLLYAIENDDLSLTKYLIELGANVNFHYEIRAYPNSSEDQLQIYPLMKAVHERRFDIIKLLLVSGANVTAVDAKNRSVMHYLDHAANANQHDHCANIVHILVQAGAAINQLDIHRRNSLNVAINGRFCCEHIILGLLAEGASMNIGDYSNHTPLHWLMYYCMSPYTSDLFISLDFSQFNDIDLNAQDNYGLTSFHHILLAASTDYQSIKYYDNQKRMEKLICISDNLVKAGGKCDIATYFGRTPLHFCSRIFLKRTVEILIKFFIDNGCSVNSIDGNGHSALDLSIAANNEWASLALIEYGGKTMRLIKPIENGYMPTLFSENKLYPRIGYNEIRNDERDNQPDESGINEFLNECINNSVLENDTFSNIVDHIHQFVIKLCKIMNEVNSKLIFSPYCSGSVSEKTKIDIPDEFDYLLNISSSFEEYFEIIEYDDCIGYAQLKLKQDINLPLYSYWHSFTHNNLFCSRMFLCHFETLLHKALNEQSHILEEYNLELASYEDSCYPFKIIEPDVTYGLEYTSKASTCIKLTHLDVKNSRLLNLSLDLVPCLFLKQWISGQLITIYNSDDMSTLLLTKCRQKSFHLSESPCTYLRLSFSRVETKVFTEMPPIIRKAYMLIKHFGIWYGECRSNEFYQIPSYVVKMALFDYIFYSSEGDKCRPHGCNDTKIVKWAIIILKCIEKACIDKLLPLIYFTECVNVLPSEKINHITQIARYWLKVLRRYLVKKDTNYDINLSD